MSTEIHQITVEAGPDALQKVHSFCIQTLDAGDTDDRCLAVQLVLEELITNIIRHGYGESAGGSIQITLRVEPGEAVVELRDRAPAFDPVSWRAPTDHSGEGKRGLPLVRRLTDRFEYERTAEHENLLLVSFRLPTQERQKNGS